MAPPLPSFTSTWHNDTYPAISPTRPELSAAGKTVIITGAGSGIGRATAVAFSRAGASNIILIGRTESTLLGTQKALICPSQVYALNVVDEGKLAEVAAAEGTWDILVLEAGYLAGPESIRDSSVDDWWLSFETNVKGSMVPAKVFLPTANPSHASIIALTTAVVLPPTMLPGLSAYITSKLAVVKLVEFLSAENPNLFVAALHPGMVNTDILQKTGVDIANIPIDSVDLPADFTVWLASPEASFLKGRQVWANWDVDELRARAGDIQAGLLLTAGIHGWPFAA